MLLETFSLGLILPILGLLTQEDISANYPALKPVLELLGNPGRQQLIIMTLSLFTLVYLFKTMFLSFFIWQQSRFVFGLQASLSERLFKLYLGMPYVFHLQRNSAGLIHNSTAETGMVTKTVQSLVTIITEISIFTGVAILLFFVEPTGSAIVTAVLVIVAALAYLSTKGKILEWGKIRQYHEAQRLQHLQQGLGSIKEVKLLGREANFIQKYDEHNQASAVNNQKWFTMQGMPRICMEMFAVLGLFVLISIMTYQGHAMETLIPTLGIFTAAAFRIMPSVSRLLVAFQSLKYAYPAVSRLYDEFQLTNTDVQVAGKSQLSYRHEMRLANISFTYRDSSKPVLTDVYLELLNGQTIGLIGETGSGKTTLVDILLGLIMPERGTMEVDGRNVYENLRSWQEKIGYVPQSIYLTDNSIRENVALGLDSEHIDDRKIWSALEAAQLDKFVTELDMGLDTVVGERGVKLSGGQRQRIGIARALYHEPEVLVLDEATSSLDNETEQKFMDTVFDMHGKKTIIIVAHRLSTLERCDHIYRISRGKIVEHGSPGKILDRIA